MRILLKRQAADCFEAAANIEEEDWYVKAAYAKAGVGGGQIILR